MLHVSEVARIYGDQLLFEEVTLDLDSGERLGLIGENGSGKSTLLRLLAGLEPPDAGTVTRVGRVALLAQQNETGPGRVLDAVTPPELWQAQQTFGRAAEALNEATDTALAAFAQAEEVYRMAGGYDFEARAAAVLGGLDLVAEAQAACLSGGQQRRLMLARLLLSPADIYMLDEPTNHLDAEGVQWLESWIVSSGAAFIVASHDRALLDAVCTRTAELERGTLTLYPGNYSAAMNLKATLREAQQRDYDAYKRKRAALNSERGRLKSVGRSADTFSHRRAGNVPLLQAKNKAQDVANTLAGQARAIERRLERLDREAVNKPYDDHRRLRLELPPVPPGPAEVLSVRDLTVKRGEKTVLAGIDLHVRRADRIALVGPNGSGKSSLLGALLGTLPASGVVRWGEGLRLYVAGQQGEELTGLQTVTDALLNANPELTPHQLHEVAAQVGLPGPEAALVTLSGGQRTRLSLARLGVTRAQVMVLDEPTNHLDIHMIEVLEEVLTAFPGTVLLASHDRRLIERVATRLWHLGGGEVRETLP